MASQAKCAPTRPIPVGGWPDLDTLRRYARACGDVLSIAFGTLPDENFNLKAGIALGADGAQQHEPAQVRIRHRSEGGIATTAGSQVANRSQ